MKNREEGDCPTYSLFYAKVQLCYKNNFSPCSKHFGVHSHINKNMINTAQLCHFFYNFASTNTIYIEI